MLALKDDDTIMITCPWHVEETPSCAVHLPTASVYCFGCGLEATIAETIEDLNAAGRDTDAQMIDARLKVHHGA